MTKTSAVDQSVCRYPACQSSGGCQGVCSKSIVRSNLLTERFYTPYCGSVEKCSHGMPRTRFDGEQFACRCGWRSGRAHRCLVDNRATVGECQQCGCIDGLLISGDNQQQALRSEERK